ncbi:MAG: thioredoxin family protein [Candidatus Bathyarchaeia archaeon]
MAKREQRITEERLRAYARRRVHPRLWAVDDTREAMRLIPEQLQEFLRRDFAKRMQDDVTLVVFTEELESRECEETRKIVEEVAGLSDRVKVQVLDFAKDSGKAEALRVDKIPAVVLQGKRSYGVRFFGLPYGYELHSLTEAIVDVSRGGTGLSESTKEKLRTIERPMHIQVFVTLNCPRCPEVVRLAHQFAVENPWISADMVETSAFPFLTLRYEVRSVPKVVVNERSLFEGLATQEEFLKRILSA